MDDKKLPTDIVKLRTYADDFERVHEKLQPKQQQSVPPAKALETLPENIAIKAPVKILPNKPPALIAPVEPKKSTHEAAVENPPFHFLQDSAPGETTLNSDTRDSQKTSSVGVFGIKKSPIVPTVIKTKSAPTPTLHNNAASLSAAVLKSDLHSDADKDSILTTKDDIFDIHQANTGTREGSIITDQKYSRPGIIRSIGIALAEWFTDKTAALRTPKAPVRTITKSDTRKETIAAAAQNGNLAPKDDHASVADRLRQVERSTPSSGFTIKKPEALATPSWSHSIDAETSTDQTAASTEIPVITIPDQEPELTPEVVPAPTPAPTPAESVPPPQPIRKPEPVTHIPEPETPLPTRQYAPTPAPLQSNNTLLIIIIGIAAIILGIIVAFVLFGQRTPDTVAIVTIPSPIPVEQQIPIVLSSEFINALTVAAQESTASLIQLYPVVPGEDGDIPATAPVILAAMEAGVSGTFSRSIEEITFGSLVTDSFIILKTNSFDATLSGMIGWETTMSTDLSPFFGPVVRESFDPTSRGASQVRPAFFVDTLINNKDVRLLVDENKNERIMYSLLDRNTVLITTSRESFITLSDRLR